MSDKGSLAEPSSTLGRLRLRKEKAGFREAGFGDGSGGGEEGGDESSESPSWSASEEKIARSAAAGLEGAVTEDAGASEVFGGALAPSTVFSGGGLTS